MSLSPFVSFHLQIQFSSFCIPNPSLSNYDFPPSPSLCIFASCPFSMSHSPPAAMQADLWYSPSVLSPGSDYTNGFCYGGRSGGWEGNPTAPGLGFFNSSLKAAGKGCVASFSTPCFSLSCLGRVLCHTLCCHVSHGWW